MIAGSVALIALSIINPGMSIAVYQNIVITSQMLQGIGVTVALSATAGLLNPTPLDPSNIGPQGQLPVQSPNPLWRICYGIFQFAGAITFVDGPILNWAGTGSGLVCNNQYVHRVHTLTAHQIAGFLAVVIDGQTYNFGTDLVLLTNANNSNGQAGPPGMWAFISNSNPWSGQIFFEFDCGDPGNANQPFPGLQSNATWLGIPFGSTRWTAKCLQRGRSKVHVFLHYVAGNNSAPWGPLGGAPQPYVLTNGRVPIVEFKIAGRIIRDYRVVTAWQPGATYSQFNYVLATGADFLLDIFVQQNASGVSAGNAPNFAGIGPGALVSDGTCLWQNCGTPFYAAGSGFTALNDPRGTKLGGPGGTILIADAWQGSAIVPLNLVIEAPIGWLQQATAVSGPTGLLRPNFSTVAGSGPTDGGVTWTCLGRSQYATCLPDNDGTQNQGGFSNPALVIADYLQTPKNQFGLGATLTADSIDSVIAAANICDEPVVIEVF
jgi:hypothetical protein